MSKAEPNGWVSFSSVLGTAGGPGSYCWLQGQLGGLEPEQASEGAPAWPTPRAANRPDFSALLTQGPRPPPLDFPTVVAKLPPPVRLCSPPGAAGKQIQMAATVGAWPPDTGHLK